MGNAYQYIQAVPEIYEQSYCNDSSSEILQRYSSLFATQMAKFGMSVQHKAVLGLNPHGTEDKSVTTDDHHPFFVLNEYQHSCHAVSLF
jgi:hypothetical protein